MMIRISVPSRTAGPFSRYEAMIFATRALSFVAATTALLLSGSSHPSASRNGVVGVFITNSVVASSSSVVNSSRSSADRSYSNAVAASADSTMPTISSPTSNDASSVRSVSRIQPSVLSRATSVMCRTCFDAKAGATHFRLACHPGPQVDVNSVVSPP